MATFLNWVSKTNEITLEENPRRSFLSETSHLAHNKSFHEKHGYRQRSFKSWLLASLCLTVIIQLARFAIIFWAPNTHVFRQ